MISKHKTILEASKKLLLVDLTCWNVVEEILNEVYEAGRQDKLVYRNDKQKKRIEQYCSKTNKHIASFDSIADARDALGMSKVTIIDNLKGRTKCRRFIFKYSNDEKSKKREVAG